MILWLLYFLSIESELKVSDTFLRLPSYCEQEGTHPYQILTIYSPNVQLEAKNESIISVEKLPSDSTITIANISVLYSGTIPISTGIVIKSNENFAQINVSIDTIDHLKILSTENVININTYVPIHVDAYNSEGLKFSSLNGTKLEWGKSNDALEFESFDTNISYLQDMIKDDPSYIIIKGNRESETNITCKLPCRNAQIANSKFKIYSPILFLPDYIYLLKGTKSDLHLYYAFHEKEDKLKPIKYIDLQNDQNAQFSIVSLSPNVAEVSKTGQVIAHELGQATIVGRSQVFHGNVANAIIDVVNPDRIEWESEQWIKPGYLNKGEGSVGPFKPTLNNISFYYKEHKIEFTNNLKVHCLLNWEAVGTHKINLTLPEINVTQQGIVHTCPPPKVSEGKLRIHISDKNSEVTVEGGSGHFQFEYDNSYIKIEEKGKIAEQNGILYSKHRVIPNKEGRITVKIVDEKLPDYQATVDIEIHSNTNEQGQTTGKVNQPVQASNAPSPAPQTPTQQTPAPQKQTQQTPASQTQAEQTPAPQKPTQQTPAPQTQAEHTPAPQKPTQQTPAPQTQAEHTPAPVEQKDRSEQIREDVLFTVSSLITFAMAIAAIIIL